MLILALLLAGGELLEDAARAARQYVSELPQFFCRQRVQRMVNLRPYADWRPVDTIEAEVTFEGGKESYRSLRRGPERVDETGLFAAGWTKGEWGTALINVFHPESRAAFLDAGEFNVKGVTGHKYSFHVLQANSRWRLQCEGQSLLAAYAGSVWVDGGSRRAVRLEYEARDLPRDFPLDAASTVIEYGWVIIAGREHLLPVRSSTVFCLSGTRVCNARRIDFLDYRKFEVDSGLSFEK